MTIPKQKKTKAKCLTVKQFRIIQESIRAINGGWEDFSYYVGICQRVNNVWLQEER